MMNSYIGKGKATFPLGAMEGDENHQWALRTEKNTNVLNVPQWCTKNVLKMLKLLSQFESMKTA